MRDKGVSPVIATVLLIAMVVVIGMIIFLWFQGMTQESITKFEGTNIELVCDDVSYDASYSGGELSIVNNGNVPIYRMKMKVVDGGSYDTTDLEGFDGLSQGGSFSGGISVGSATNIILIPVLLGNSESGKRTYVCEEDLHGYEIVI
jgi:flagellin-like protein